MDQKIVGCTRKARGDQGETGGGREGVLGLPRPPLGRPKWVGDIYFLGFGIHYHQNVCYHIGNTVFLKNNKIDPGGGPGCVLREI